MQQEHAPELEPIKRATETLVEGFDNLFDNAGIMMHTINRKGRLIKANCRWLATLSYDREEVLGRESIGFLTEERRAQAAATLPLFWRSGVARNSGYQFVRKKRASY